MDGEIEREFKIVLLGNAAVGKTSIINRMIKKTFNEFNPSTVGAMFMTYMAEVDGKSYKLQIWDTAGQERLRTIAPLYYRDSHGVMLVYDITSQASLDGLDGWYKDLQEKGSEKTSVIVIGNKIDLLDSQEVPIEKGEKFARERGTGLVLVSAKDGRGIEEAIRELVKKILHDQANGPQKPLSTATKIDRKTFYNKPKSQEGGGCCGK